MFSLLTGQFLDRFLTCVSNYMLFPAVIINFLSLQFHKSEIMSKSEKLEDLFGYKTFKIRCVPNGFCRTALTIAKVYPL